MDSEDDDTRNRTSSSSEDSDGEEEEDLIGSLIGVKLDKQSSKKKHWWSSEYMEAPIVMDFGTSTAKIGFAGEELTPSIVMPSLVAKSKSMGSSSSSSTSSGSKGGKPVGGVGLIGMVEAAALRRKQESYVGFDVLEAKEALDLSYPIKNGVISDWDAMEKLWQYSFEQLETNVEDHPILLIEQPFNPRAAREKILQIMLETFNAPMVNLSIHAVCSLFGEGRTSGLVIDSGDGCTHCVPIYKGDLFSHAIQRVGVNGSDVTNSLSRLLESENLKPAVIKRLKESVCSVALDYDKSLKSAQEKSYKLPDGRIIKMRTEGFTAAEALFEPSEILENKESDGLHIAAFKAIQKVEIDFRKDLLLNLVLSGGNTKFPGITERLTKEMKVLAPPAAKVNVIAPDDRDFSPWIGGAVLAARDIFESMCVSKEDYDEIGASVIHSRCPNNVEM